MRIRMKIQVSGTFEGLADGVSIGDEVDVPDERGARYCAMHYAEPVAQRAQEEHAVAPEVEQREAADTAPEEETPKTTAKRAPRQAQ